MQTLKITKSVIKCNFQLKSNSKIKFSSKPPRTPSDTFTPPRIRKRERKPSDGPPLPPGKCCQKGCSNCVWIRYGEELVLYYKDGGVEAMKAIDSIEDPALKAFLKMEMKARVLKN